MSTKGDTLRSTEVDRLNDQKNYAICKIIIIFDVSSFSIDGNFHGRSWTRSTESKLLSVEILLTQRCIVFVIHSV